MDPKESARLRATPHGCNKAERHCQGGEVDQLWDGIHRGAETSRVIRVDVSHDRAPLSKLATTPQWCAGLELIDVSFGTDLQGLAERSSFVSGYKLYAVSRERPMRTPPTMPADLELLLIDVNLSLPPPVAER